MPRRTVYARQSMGGATPDEIPRHRRASQSIRRSYVEKGKMLYRHLHSRRFTSASLVITFASLLPFLQARCPHSIGCRSSLGGRSFGILLPSSSRPLFLPFAIGFGIPRSTGLSPSRAFGSGCRRVLPSTCCCGRFRHRCHPCGHSRRT